VCLPGPLRAASIASRCNSIGRRRPDVNLFSTVHLHIELSGVTEDQEKQAEKDVQKLTDDYVAKIDQHLAQKEKEIMTV